MMRHTITVGAAALALTLGAVPVMGQERQGPANTRPASGERGGGSATPRGGESGGSAPRGGSSGGGMSGGGSVGSSSTPSAPSSSGSSIGERPSRSAERAPRRTDDSSQATGRRAVPRGESASGNGSVSREAAASSSGSSERHAVERRSAPVYSRPANGRSVTGTAVERRPGLSPIDRDLFFIYRPYYYPYGYWGPGLGYGLGYLYYDPFYYPGSYGYGGFGYGGYGYGSGYGSGYYSSGGYDATYRDAGSLRLKIKPREAQVFIDGYFVGVVDSFDGVFQSLKLDGGGHRVEVKADGFEPLTFEVLITPGETVTYKGEMKRQ